MIRTNVEAVVDMTTMLVGQMASRRRGAVLNTASTAAFQPLPGQAGYAATKAFVLSYSHAIRAELAPFGVTVTALCPGPVKTGFGQAAGLDEEEEQALPKFMWIPVGAVGKAAVDGLAQGRAVVIPGMGNKVGAFGGRFAPHRFVSNMVARRHPALRRSR